MIKHMFEAIISLPELLTTGTICDCPSENRPSLHLHQFSVYCLFSCETSNPGFPVNFMIIGSFNREI